LLGSGTETTDGRICVWCRFGCTRGLGIVVSHRGVIGVLLGYIPEQRALTLLPLLLLPPDCMGWLWLCENAEDVPFEASP
jgi:hypothetical protein